MVINRIGPRLKLAEQMARNPENKGRLLAVEYYTSQGRTLRAKETVGKSITKVQLISLQVDLGIEMVLLPAGIFIFQGVQGVRFNGCKLAKTPFTNGQFRKLLELRPKELTKIMDDPQARLDDSLKHAYKSEEDECPFVRVSQIEAEKIAKLTGYRLPTELEWERAASFINGRQYPFGDEFDERKVSINIDCRRVRSVFAHSEGASPEGILDLSGNALEWTDSWSGDIDLSDPGNPKLAPKWIGMFKIWRGWGWGDPKGNVKELLKNTVRTYGRAEARYYETGFRLAGNI